VVEVLATDEFRDWYLALPDSDADAVTVSVERLEQMGITLSHPHSSDIKGSAYPLRELRMKAGHSPLRVFYAFDPRRNAVLLIGGSKVGSKRFFDDYIPKAEMIWAQYLKETKE
jgi:hypothetical protein